MGTLLERSSCHTFQVYVPNFGLLLFSQKVSSALEFLGTLVVCVCSVCRNQNLVWRCTPPYAPFQTSEIPPAAPLLRPAVCLLGSFHQDLGQCREYEVLLVGCALFLNVLCLIDCLTLGDVIALSFFLFLYFFFLLHHISNRDILIRWPQCALNFYISFDTEIDKYSQQATYS